MLAEVIFWASLGLIAYAYFGYPLVIGALARLFPKSIDRKEIFPKVSFIMAGYNEEKVIGKKLENVLGLDYPKDRLEVIFGSDGSDDSTVKIARGYEAWGVKVLEFKARRGKVSVLNDAVAVSSGEVLVFSDSRQMYDRSALKKLVSCLNDPGVGAVSGELVLASKQGFGNSMVAYWNYEKTVRRAESETGSVMGVTGAIWAMKRELFEPYPPDTLLDDLYQPLRVVLKGYRVVFEPEAKAFDEAAARPEHEIKRKVRTIAGNWQIFFGMKNALDPLRNRAIFQLVSHKLLRVMVPFFLASALASNILLAGEPFYMFTLAAQAGFYGLCLLSLASPLRGGALKLFSAFTILNFSALMGFLRYVTNTQEAIWKK